MHSTTDKNVLRRIDLILREVESLPTLPAVATRLLSLTTSQSSDIAEVVNLISADPALTAKILRLTQQTDLSFRNVTSIEQAVKLLGFSAVRNAVLSLKILEVFDDDERVSTASPGLDRVKYWRHSLGVAVAAEDIAAQDSNLNIDSGQAFICGLLHDIGKLALDYILPKSYAKVVAYTDANQGNIAEIEQRIIGVNHHTIGKRIAEIWQLPFIVKDVIWFHGTQLEGVPDTQSKSMVGLIQLADQVVRESHIGYSGNYHYASHHDNLADGLGVGRKVVRGVMDELHAGLERRLLDLGIEEIPTKELYLQSIAQANQCLGKINQNLQQSATQQKCYQNLVGHMDAFGRSSDVSQGVAFTLDQIVSSVCQPLNFAYSAVLVGVAGDDDSPNEWLIAQYDPDYKHMIGASQIHDCVEDLSALDLGLNLSQGINLRSMLPWVGGYLLNSQDMVPLSAIGLSMSDRVKAVLVYPSAKQGVVNQISPLIQMYIKSLAEAVDLSDSKDLSEDLAQANLALSQAQEALLDAETMVRLGELAAGAAHEMNNPLMVISGRSQQLASKLHPGSEEQKTAKILVEQSSRLSDLITSLRLFAEKPEANMQSVDIKTIIEKTVRRVRESLSGSLTQIPITIAIKDKISYVTIDPQMISDSLFEVLRNALQASPKSTVAVSVSLNKEGGGFRITVSDDGIGMDDHTLKHALDPFFSAKSAGRRVGMGLPRTQIYLTAHLGTIRLVSTQGRGTVVTLSVGLD